MRLIQTIIIIIFIFSNSYSQETKGGRVHGSIIGDYFYKAGGDSQAYGDSLSQYSRPLSKDFQGFQLRRFYLYYDYTFSEEFFTRFLLESNSKSLEAGGRQGIFIKSAYLEWKNVIPKSNLLLGLIPTPTWSSVEEKWGYRSIEKTITDARNLGCGTDMGVSLRGALPTNIPMDYAIMISNGNAQRPENNKYKKYYAMLSGSPIQNFFIETNFDYEPASGKKDCTTWKTFFCYQKQNIMIGAEIVEQVQSKKDSLQNDYAPFGLSLFSWYSISNQCKLYGRIDYYDPNRFVSNVGFYEYFISLGFDYIPIKDIHFIPNIWINTFTDKSSAGRKKDADVVPRITFFFIFN